MKINIQSINFKNDEKLQNFVEEKVGKLSRFESDALSAEVTLTEDGKSGDHKTCDIRLVIPGNDYFVKKSAASFEEAVADASEALRMKITSSKPKY